MNAPLPQDLQIDAVCDRFEAQWAAGARPRIEDLLREVSPAAHADLIWSRSSSRTAATIFFGRGFNSIACSRCRDVSHAAQHAARALFPFRRRTRPAVRARRLYPQSELPRCDLYSLGCTLYRLLTGKNVYEADTGERRARKERGRQKNPLHDDALAGASSLYSQVIRPWHSLASLARMGLISAQRASKCI